MKKIAAICILAAAQAYAGTAWVNVAARKVNWYQHPQIVQVEGRTVSLAPVLTPSALAYLAAAGWTAIECDCHPTDAVLDYDAVPPIRCMTPAELEAREAAEAQAAQEAAEQALLPRQEPTGIEAPWIVLLDSTNRTVGIGVEATPAGDLITYQFHASPVDWKKVDANRAAARAARETKRADAAAAKKSGQLQRRIAALEAMLGVE
jgi:hypothetical protein